MKSSPVHRIALFLACLMLAPPVLSQEVSVLAIGKTRRYEQTGPATVGLNQFSISSSIEGTELSASFPSSSNRFQPSGGDTTALFFDDEDGDGWWNREELYPTQSALDAAFPNVGYSFLIGTSPAVALSFSTGSYPTVPVVTASAGTWLGGKLLITPAEAAAGFTLTSNVSNGNGFLTMDVYSDTDDILYEVIEDNIGEPIIGSVPAASLQVGGIYEVETEFDQVVSSQALDGQTWAPAEGAFGFALLNSNTRFVIEVLADPAPLATDQAAHARYSALLGKYKRQLKAAKRAGNAAKVKRLKKRIQSTVAKLGSL